MKRLASKLEWGTNFVAVWLSRYWPLFRRRRIGGKLPDEDGSFKSEFVHFVATPFSNVDQPFIGLIEHFFGPLELGGRFCPQRARELYGLNQLVGRAE